MAIKAFRYRLYPTKTHAALLETQLRACCDLYNAALQHRRDAHRKAGVHVSCNDQTKEYTQVRHDGSTAIVLYKLGQDVLQRVDRAFDAFFRRVKAGQPPGYPRFKSFRRYDSFTYINYGKAPHVDKKGKLILKGIGHIKVRWHRPIRGTTKTCTIKREAGRWYVIFSVEYTREQLPCPGREGNQTPYAEHADLSMPHRIIAADAIVGLDVGLHAFATLDDGHTIENPRYLRQAQAQLRRAQRRLARRKKGSHRRRKAVMMLQRAHVHVVQQRRHFHHVEARKLVNRYGVIAVEDLQIKNMTASAKGTTETPGKRVRQKAGLNREILSAAWGQFLLILFAKAVDAGRIGIKVPARGTSQRCPCGAAVQKRLKDRWHFCLVCGLSVPRDHASAMEIKRLALQQLSA